MTLPIIPLPCPMKETDGGCRIAAETDDVMELLGTSLALLRVIREQIQRGDLPDTTEFELNDFLSRTARYLHHDYD